MEDRFYFVGSESSLGTTAPFMHEWTGDDISYFMRGSESSSNDVDAAESDNQDALEDEPRWETWGFHDEFDNGEMGFQPLSIDADDAGSGEEDELDQTRTRRRCQGFDSTEDSC